MVPTVFGYWNIFSCEDLGHIVFNMIREEILGKNDSDSIEQFREGYSFHDAFVVPFIPTPSPGPAAKAAPESLRAQTGT